MRKLTILGAAALLWLAPAAAGVPASAQDDARDGGDIQALIGELRTLIEKGESERLADPWFLEDLERLVAKYSDPWRRPLYKETFSEEGAPPAPWRVVSGEMDVGWRDGLRSRVRGPSRQAERDAERDERDEPERERNTGREILGAVLKGVMNQGRSDGDREREETSRDAERAAPAVAVAETRITNAFEIAAELRLRPLSDGTDVAADLGVYQAINGNRAGYRVVAEGADDSLTLLRVGARGGRAVLAVAEQPPRLDDGKPHDLTWTRDRQGRMELAVDGETVVSTVDRAFGDPWHGLVLRNAGGEVRLGRIAVEGTE